MVAFLGNFAGFVLQDRAALRAVLNRRPKPSAPIWFTRERSVEILRCFDDSGGCPGYYDVKSRFSKCLAR